MKTKQTVLQQRIFKGDKWNKRLGSRVPMGAEVTVIKFCFRRRVIIDFKGEKILTMLWCTRKIN